MIFKYFLTFYGLYFHIFGSVVALFLLLQKSIESFIIKYDASCRFFIEALYQVEEVLFLDGFFFLIIKVYWILSNAFPVFIEKITEFYFFILLIWHITLLDFQMLIPLWIPGTNLTWHVFLDSVCYFAEDFCIHIYKTTDL